MPNYKVYHDADFIAPLVIVVTIYVCFAIQIVVYWLCCSCCKQNRCNTCLERVMYCITKLVYGKSIKLRNENGERKLFVFRRSVPQYLLSFYCLQMPTVLCCIFVTFWAVFLIDESFTCDPGLDCFPFDTSGRKWIDGHPLQQQPIINCSSFESVNTVTIVCHTFVLNYSAAFSAAGGLLALIVMVMEKFKELGKWAFDRPGAFTGKVGTCVRSRPKVFGIVISFVTTGAWLAIGIVGFLVPFFQETIAKSDQDKLLFV